MSTQIAFLDENVHSLVFMGENVHTNGIFWVKMSIMWLKNET